MCILKNGQHISDSRLTRIEDFDERSKNYKIQVKNNAPMEKLWRCNTHLNQGYEGSCIGHGIAHSLIADPVYRKMTHEDAVNLYYIAQHLDKWEGGEYHNAHPHYSGTSVLAGCKAAKSQELIESYHWGFGVSDLIKGLQEVGPAVLGIPWYTGMTTTNKNGLIHPEGKRRGGHCILCKGIFLDFSDVGTFVLHNSWGDYWGIDGDCYISVSDMAYLLKEGGEVVFLKQKKLSYWKRFLTFWR